MTVREHLMFYARAKGIKTVAADVNLVMKKIGLQAYENRLASKLSGGNKRKLSLAIALLGWSPNILSPVSFQHLEFVFLVVFGQVF
jgi:ATP-binding cassette subfamily A (ABC1) protein 3